VSIEERQVGRVADAAADQHMVTRRAGRYHRPFIVAVALAARPAGAGLPRRFGHEPGQGGRRLAAGRGGDREVDRDGEDVAFPGVLAGGPVMCPELSGQPING